MKYLLTILISFLTLSLNAQNQIATLNHEGNIITEYGVDAFEKLLNIAEDGDIITLSSGTFRNSNVNNKHVTIRGAGINLGLADNTYSEPTVIAGYGWTDVSESDNPKNCMTVEGIEFSSSIHIKGNGMQFNKCKFKGIGCGEGTKNCYFLHCIIEGMAPSSGTYITIINSVINGYEDYYGSNDPREISFINSICNNISNRDKIRKWTGWGERFQNCILTYSGAENIIIENSSCSHNLFIGKNNGNPFSNCDEGHPNYVLPQETNVFEENSFYKLSDDFKSYHGTDGTEVGIYGGPYPFSSVPSNPQIKKFQVAPKTTVDGKLSVDIEISIPE